MNSSPTSAGASHPLRHPEVERFGEAGARHWATPTYLVLELQGVLGHPVEQYISGVIAQARRFAKPLVVDVAAVTHLTVDVLALFLNAQPDPGVSFQPPLPQALVRIMEMTGTHTVFSLHRSPIAPPTTS